MYGRPERSRIQVNDLVMFSKCPASILTPRSRNPRPPVSPHLFRWQAVKDAVLKWHESDSADPFEDARRFAFGDLSDVQLEVATQLFRWYTQIIDRDTPIREAGGQMLAVSENGATEIAASPTFLVPDEDGTYEVLKLRTGSSSATDEYEAAVLASGNIDDVELIDVSAINDVLLVPGETVKTDISPDRQEALLKELFAASALKDQSGRGQLQSDLRPGQHCSTCARTAYCGAYPLLSPRRPGDYTRVLRLSKTSLERIETCERRAVWGAVHQIPEEAPETDESSGTSFGLLAHEALAAVVSSDDPLATFEQITSRFPASEVADLRMMVEAHVAIESSEHVTAKRYDPEVNIGFVFLVEGWDPSYDSGQGQVAVALMTRADAIEVGGSGHLVVLDHKTSESAPRLEKELLAVAMAARQKRDKEQVERVEVHQHFLRRKPGERCEVTVFGRDDLNEAASALRDAASRFASFDAYQALQPRSKAVADGECFQCGFRQRCQAWGGPGQTD